MDPPELLYARERYPDKQVITLKSNRGTLLAHTMGLGKTLQVIAVLLTLASLGSDAKVEMAAHLKKDNRRFLVICPPTIVENWGKEFKHWTPRECYDSLGSVVAIHQLQTIDQRLYEIQRWFREGGVLIIGYAQFRAILTAKNTTDEAIEQRKKWLLNPGADVVVADEAHTIKNPKAKIAELFSQIKTGSRIATTGSPLSNHLEEYWSMMEWISPGFLGPLKRFTDQYITPIKIGLYQDSKTYQRKISQTRLERLKALLDKKIHRKDIKVIQDDLMPKTEFVISVSLTKLQQKLYDGLLEQVKDSGRNAGLFKWLNLLRLICNHPSTLRVSDLPKHLKLTCISATSRRKNGRSLKTVKMFRNADQPSLDPTLMGNPPRQQVEACLPWTRTKMTSFPKSTNSSGQRKSLTGWVKRESNWTTPSTATRWS